MMRIKTMRDYKNLNIGDTFYMVYVKAVPKHKVVKEIDGVDWFRYENATDPIMETHTVTGIIESVITGDWEIDEVSDWGVYDKIYKTKTTGDIETDTFSSEHLIEFYSKDNRKYGRFLFDTEKEALDFCDPFIIKAPNIVGTNTCTKCGIDLSISMGYVCGSPECPISTTSTC